MGTLKEATESLRDLEALLRTSSPGALDAVAVAERVRGVRELLSSESARWIGTTEAKRLLGVRSENTVKAWARLGLLRSRTLPNGRVKVLLDDVLERRVETEDLAAIGGDELSVEELRTLRRNRPGKTPWGREQAERLS